jgi:hypothetical protein
MLLRCSDAFCGERGTFAQCRVRYSAQEQGSPGPLTLMEDFSKLTSQMVDLEQLESNHKPLFGFFLCALIYRTFCLQWSPVCNTNMLLEGAGSQTLVSCYLEGLLHTNGAFPWDFRSIGLENSLRIF